VQRVRICPLPQTYADALYIKLTDASGLQPTGTDPNGNVLTSDMQLNQLFAAYEVKSMNLLIPGIYSIGFYGDINGLKAALEALDFGIDSADFIGVAMLLNTDKNELAGFSSS
jgi:hypothetical protein